MISDHLRSERSMGDECLANSQIESFNQKKLRHLGRRIKKSAALSSQRLMINCELIMCGNCIQKTIPKIGIVVRC